ncbi:hypothetical protein A2U01_0017161 [Trifolium medium]|uniref:Uncharacterized protein n=1 Tax=Trifolium medium TaxID=97028 RepID=A0A392NAV0_9FABA|nr:hypothetical protein [Trifolium medium]
MDERTQQPSNNDSFLLDYSPSDLRTASEFLNQWLPFLSKDLCRRCSQTLSDRILSLDPESQNQNGSSEVKDELEDNCECHSLGSWKDGVQGNSTLEAQSPRMSWADMVQEDDEFGLELHTGIFSAAEQKRIVGYVASLQEKGRKGELKGL